MLYNFAVTYLPTYTGVICITYKRWMSESDKCFVFDE